MATSFYFLGANTPTGFCSKYDTLFADPRLDKVLILKGGAGCGKSTLMRAAGTAAEALGYETEQIRCSSDPASLDGIVIPAAHLALVDGTAPHVVEPPLCGCGANYLNLGTFYNEAVLSAQKEQLFALKEQNAACYPLATACFRAAAAAAEALHQMTSPEAVAALQVAFLPHSVEAGRRGRALPRFYTAFTPDGALCAPVSCKTVWLLQDSYGLAPEILTGVAEAYLAAGRDVITGYSPLAPDKLSHVIIPAESLAYVTTSDLFPYKGATAGKYNLDTLAEQQFTPTQMAHAYQLRQELRSAAEEGLKFLREAKSIHDALETLYHPAVDFAGVTAITEGIVEDLQEVLKNPD